MYSPRKRGRRLDSTVLEEAAATASAVATPITDVRASRDYRAAMVRVIALRALTAAARRAAGEAVPVPASNDDSTPRL